MDRRPLFRSSASNAVHAPTGNGRPRSGEVSLPARKWCGDVLALIAGIALPFAFSPYFLWPLSVLSLAVLFFCWRGVSARRAVWRGWLHGVGAFGVGVSWIVSSFQFSHIALPIALALTLGFVAFLALYPALVGGLAAVLSRGARGPWPLFTVYPAAWVLGEWLRGWFFTGFTWLQLGYAQVDGVFAGLLPVSGVYGTGLVVALCSGGLAWLLLSAVRWPLTNFAARLRAPIAALSAITVLAAALSALLATVSWTAVSGQPLRVALLQGNVPQDQKWLPSMREPTLRRYMSMTTQHLGADLVIWPETAVPGQRAQMKVFIEQLHTLAREARSAVMFGVPEYDGTPARAYNSVELVGSARGRYRKRHLVPFGEYLPLDAILRPITQRLRIPVSDFAAGAAEQASMSVSGHQLAIFICYEIVFGNEVIAALPEAAVLVTISNDAWFGDSIGPHQHLQMARTRALETGRTVLRATNTGITAIIDANGAVQARLPQFTTAALAGQALPRSGVTPYVRFGDAPALLLCFGGLLGGAWWTRKRTRAQSQPI
ncbi:MAG: apolipoprotein N-acyltransferase [Gammaproteobacteria bacterium]|jgi:apolipoprotein N-acyltransferase